MSRNIIKKYSISFYWLPFEAIFIVISLIIRELNKKHRYNVGINRFSQISPCENLLPLLAKTRPRPTLSVSKIEFERFRSQ